MNMWHASTMTNGGLDLLANLRADERHLQNNFFLLGTIFEYNPSSPNPTKWSNTLKQFITYILIQHSSDPLPPLFKEGK